MDKKETEDPIGTAIQVMRILVARDDEPVKTPYRKAILDELVASQDEFDATDPTGKTKAELATVDEMLRIRDRCRAAIQRWIDFVADWKAGLR